MLKGFRARCGSEGRRHFEPGRGVVTPPSVKPDVSCILSLSEKLTFDPLDPSRVVQTFLLFPLVQSLGIYPSAHATMRWAGGPTCMYTIRQSQHPSRPACILRCPIHGPDPDRSKLRSRETSWQVVRYRTIERYSIEPGASIRSRSAH